MNNINNAITPDIIAELITKCSQGDDSAQAYFYNTYYEFLHKAVLNAIRKFQPTHITHSDSQELTHDIFIHLAKDNYAVLQQLHTPSSINAWLMRVAHNHVVSQLRKDNTRKQAHQNLAKEVSPKYNATPEELAISNENKILINNSINTLSPQEQLMIKLYYLQEIKYSDIAEILHININTVGSRLHRAKSKLQNKFKELSE